MASNQHPKKEIRQALKEAREAGWQVDPARGGRSKAWGHLHCGAVEAECSMTINSTPRNPANEAKKIRKKMAKCPHRREWTREA